MLYGLAEKVAALEGTCRATLGVQGETLSSHVVALVMARQLAACRKMNHSWK